MMISCSAEPKNSLKPELAVRELSLYYIWSEYLDIIVDIIIIIAKLSPFDALIFDSFQISG